MLTEKHDVSIGNSALTEKTALSQETQTLGSIEKMVRATFKLPVDQLPVTAWLSEAEDER